MNTIVFFISQIVPGAEFMWNEPGNLVCKVLAVHPDPQASFRGRKLLPYADVQWSDETQPSTMTLKTIETNVRCGQMIPMSD